MDRPCASCQNQRKHVVCPCYISNGRNEHRHSMCFSLLYDIIAIIFQFHKQVISLICKYLVRVLVMNMDIVVTSRRTLICKLYFANLYYCHWHTCNNFLVPQTGCGNYKLVLKMNRDIACYICVSCMTKSTNVCKHLMLINITGIFMYL